MSLHTSLTVNSVGTWTCYESIEEFTHNAIDSRAWEFGTPYSDRHSEDCALYRADNTTVEDGQSMSDEGVPAVYGPFKMHDDEPSFLIGFETKDGSEMM
ncbi:hypothetical protein HO133_006785 [Letharia lupina]|uniref:Uncharacterized protein n=1 Tax=Letharia lupina TaxID=560253 RepID=A0A8H6F7L3_9LECA|nr:uncharacterized protein HO133_006785 [Letharia lupina]KAF6217683.1 hypothetical protein HO133_006785 [Letharia lupina]